MEEVSWELEVPRRAPGEDWEVRQQLANAHRAMGHSLMPSESAAMIGDAHHHRMGTESKLWSMSAWDAPGLWGKIPLLQLWRHSGKGMRGATAPTCLSLLGRKGSHLMQRYPTFLNLGCPRRKTSKGPQKIRPAKRTHLFLLQNGLPAGGPLSSFQPVSQSDQQTAVRGLAIAENGMNLPVSSTSLIPKIEHIPFPSPTTESPIHKTPKVLTPHNKHSPNPSILGPPPINIPCAHTHPSQIASSHLAIKKYLFHCIAKKTVPMELSDEELIRKFAGLHTELGGGALVSIPDQAATSRDWSLCILAKVCTDRTVFDSQFERQTRKLWNVNPATSFKLLDRSLYLIECVNKEDQSRILTGGPWMYRQDWVVVAECKSAKDMNAKSLTHGEVWVQYHNMPLDSLTDEGVARLTSPVGIALSDPVLVTTSAKQFFRVKIFLPLNTPVKDKLVTTHPSLGRLVVHLVYERLSRICCFCGLVGHDINTCVDRARLAKIKGKMEGPAGPEMEDILKPTRGPWITNDSLVPFLADESDEATPPESTTGLKRRHSPDYTGPQSDAQPLCLSENVTSTNPGDEMGDLGDEDIPITYKKSRATVRASLPLPR